MRKTVIGIVAAAFVLGAASSAEAAQGCGIGFHREPFGGCRPNRGPVVAVPGLVAVGGFYPGRGWWDGHRYWRHRYPWRGGWRYR